MDTLSHAVWGYGLFGHRGHPWLALLFGAVPDLLSFGGIITFQIFTGTFAYDAPPLEMIPGWVFLTYDFTHSLLVAGILVAAIFALQKSVGFAMLAWPVHILLDVPFHTTDYFPTKFLWPLTDISVDGVSWHEPWIWIPNLAGIVVLLSYRWIQRKRGATALG